MSVSYDFSGKTVLVTGSTKGIGFAMANDYCKAGANLLVSGRTKEAVNKVIEDLASKYKIDLKQTPKRLIAAVGDCATKEGCDTVINVIKNECSNGHIDILVNNVGIFESKPFDKVTDDDWLKFFNVNVMSGVRLSRYCIAKMLEPLTDNDDEKSSSSSNDNNNGAATIDTSNLNVKRRGGNIVFVSSEAGVRTPPHMIHYGMTKSAQMAIARGLAQMCKGIPNVRVNSILAGPTFTAGVAAYLQGLPEYKDLGDKFDVEFAKKEYISTREPDSLKADFLNVQEIADACMYITSDNASGTTGHAFRCEGGLVYAL